jgi:hypothetical protein
MSMVDVTSGSPGCVSRETGAPPGLPVFRSGTKPLSRTVSDPFDTDEGAPRSSADCDAELSSAVSSGQSSETSSVQSAPGKPTADGSAVLCPSELETVSELASRVGVKVNNRRTLAINPPRRTAVP